MIARGHSKVKSQPNCLEVMSSYNQPQPRTSQTSKAILKELVSTGFSYKRRSSQDQRKLVSTSSQVSITKQPFTVGNTMRNQQSIARSSQLTPNESQLLQKNISPFSFQSQGQRSYKQIESMLWDTFLPKNITKTEQTNVVHRDLTEVISRNWQKFQTKCTSYSGYSTKTIDYTIHLLKLLGDEFRQREDEEIKSLFLKFLNLGNFIFQMLDDLRDSLEQRNQQDVERVQRVKQLESELDQLKINQVKYLNSNPDSIKVQKHRAIIQENIHLKIENNKLAQEIASLSETFKKVENDENLNTIKEEINHNKIEYENQLVEMQMRYTKAQKNVQIAHLSLDNLKSQKSKLETELQYQRLANEKAEYKLKHFEEDNEILNAEVVYYRERLGMQLEDFLALEERFATERLQINSLRKKIKHLQSKIDRTQIERSTNLAIPENAHIQEEMDMFAQVRQMFRHNSLFYKKIKAQMKGFKGDIIEQNQRKILEEKLRMRLDLVQRPQRNSDDPMDDTFDIYKFQFLKPTFYSLIQTKFSKYTQGLSEIHKSPEVSCYFIGQLRAMLDSKFNEHQAITNVRLISNFIEFVYSWLGKFQLDRVTRKVILLNKELAEDMRVKFYIELTKPSLNKIWEIITFRELLLDRTSNDEVYFYLFYHALHKFDFETNQNMKTQLKERCVKKNTNLVIDGNLVLRYLLEFYRSERVVRFKLIQDLFHSCSSHDVDGKLHFDFESFKIVFSNNFSECSEIEQAQLYRECFSTGCGAVTPEAFYTVACETNFFIKHLRLRGEIFYPVSDSQPEIDLREQIQQEGIYTLSRYQDFMGIYGRSIIEIGVESILEEFNQTNIQIKSSQKAIQDSKDSVKTIQLMLNLSSSIHRLGSLYLHANVNYLPNDLKQLIIRNIDGYLERLVHDPIKKLQDREEQERFKFEFNVTKIQKAVKHKIQKWYGLINRELLDKLIQGRLKNIQ